MGLRTLMAFIVSGYNYHPEFFLLRVKNLTLLAGMVYRVSWSMPISTLRPEGCGALKIRCHSFFTHIMGPLYHLHIDP